MTILSDGQYHRMILQWHLFIPTMVFPFANVCPTDVVLKLHCCVIRPTLKGMGGTMTMMVGDDGSDAIRPKGFFVAR